MTKRTATYRNSASGNRNTDHAETFELIGAVYLILSGITGENLVNRIKKKALKSPG